MQIYNIQNGSHPEFGKPENCKPRQRPKQLRVYKIRLLKQVYKAISLNLEEKTGEV